MRNVLEMLQCGGFDMKLKTLFFIALSAVCPFLNAVEMKIIDGSCSCYKEKSGREWPINDVAKAWRSLRGDIAVNTTKRMVPDEELFEYKKEYNAAAEAAYQTSDSLVKAVRNLRLANEPSYYPSDFERLFDTLNQINNHTEKWKIYERTFVHDRRLCTNGLTGRCNCPSKYYDEEIALFKRAANTNREKWGRKRKELWALFEEVSDICKKTHINLFLRQGVKFITI